MGQQKDDACDNIQVEESGMIYEGTIAVHKGCQFLLGKYSHSKSPSVTATKGEKTPINCKYGAVHEQGMVLYLDHHLSYGHERCGRTPPSNYVSSLISFDR